MKTLYLDGFSGISGDMMIGALLDLGGSQRRLEAELRKLGIAGEYHLEARRDQRAHLCGTKFDVRTRGARRPSQAPHGPKSHSHGGHGHGPARRAVDGRSFAEIRRLIEGSHLSPEVRRRALRLFRRIAEAEGRLHNVPLARVHFHEVGAVDSIVDVVGTCILLEELAPEQVLAAPPCEGHGFVVCAHGRFPVPTPATLEILKGLPMRSVDIEGELITPTGAGILAEFVEHFGLMPTMVVERIGYGLGTRNPPDHPNALRVVWGDAPRARSASSGSGDEVEVLETQVDDATAEILAAAMARLFEEGARDVFFVPALMKKGRPGTLVTVLADPGEAGRLAEVLMRETGTFGVRRRRSERICLDRAVHTVRTRLGPVQIKTGSLGGRVVAVKPEFESCRRLATKRQRPVREVWAEAVKKGCRP